VGDLCRVLRDLRLERLRGGLTGRDLALEVADAASGQVAREQRDRDEKRGREQPRSPGISAFLDQGYMLLPVGAGATLT
jgi:hypothetical protein